MKKIILPILCCIIFLSGCVESPEEAGDRISQEEYEYRKAYDDGYHAGYELGYEEGYADGHSSLEYDYPEPEFEIDEEEYLFYENFAVCVDVGESTYHKYQCWDFKADHFYIFNIDYAIDEGYHPCPNCIN